MAKIWERENQKIQACLTKPERKKHKNVILIFQGVNWTRREERRMHTVNTICESMRRMGGRKSMAWQNIAVKAGTLQRGYSWSNFTLNAQVSARIWFLYSQTQTFLLWKFNKEWTSFVHRWKASVDFTIVKNAWKKSKDQGKPHFSLFGRHERAREELKLFQISSFFHPSNIHNEKFFSLLMESFTSILRVGINSKLTFGNGRRVEKSLFKRFLIAEHKN